MRRIEDRLVGNGNLILEARRKGRSLSNPDRNVILRNRARALEEGFTRETINALEMEGERGRRGEMGYPVQAIYFGLQETGVLGTKLRLYNIEGDHPLNHSTVSVTTLLHNGLVPTDIPAPRVLYEYAKEQAFSFYIFIERGWYFLKGFRVRSK